MPSRLPTDTFDYYFSLGAERSYQAVADRFGVSKTAVVNRATKEGWQQRVERLEATARDAADQKAAESLETMSTRHLTAFRVVQGKALEALRSMSLDSAMDAVRAIDLSIKGERLVRGEPSDRTAVSVEDAIRREFDRWMIVEGDEVEDEQNEDDPPQQEGAL